MKSALILESLLKSITLPETNSKFAPENRPGCERRFYLNKVGPYQL